MIVIPAESLPSWRRGPESTATTHTRLSGEEPALVETGAGIQVGGAPQAERLNCES